MNLEKQRPIRGTFVLAIAGMLALGLAACGENEPPTAATPTVVQPAAPSESKAAEVRSATSEPAPMPKIDPNAELARKVKSTLHTTPGLEALAVDIVASDGAVTLFGTADTRDSLEKAAKAAAGVPGVKSVQNKIVVVRGS